MRISVSPILGLILLLVGSGCRSEPRQSFDNTDIFLNSYYSVHPKEGNSLDPREETLIHIGSLKDLNGRDYHIFYFYFEWGQPECPHGGYKVLVFDQDFTFSGSYRTDCDLQKWRVAGANVHLENSFGKKEVLDFSNGPPIRGKMQSFVVSEFETREECLASRRRRDVVDAGSTPSK